MGQAISTWIGTVEMAAAQSISRTGMCCLPSSSRLQRRMEQRIRQTIPCHSLCSTTATSNLSIASAAIATGSASFSFGASTSCAENGGGSLAANTSCSYALDFAPASTGSIPGSLLLTDNNLNVSAATQSISLSGTGTGTSSLSFTLPASTTLIPGTVGLAYSPVMFQAAGGTTPYRYTISAGALPAGMSFDTTGLLAGTPTAGGAFSITVFAADADSLTGSQTYSLTILQPTITVSPSTAVLPAATIASPYTQSFTAAGGISPYIYVSTGTLPPGLSLSTAGVLAGTPRAAGGPYTFTVTAIDSSTGTGPYSGISTTYSLTVGKATATVTLGNLAQTYTGSPLSATATTVPTGLAVSLTYSGSETAPTAPGTYTVVATINDPNYQGSATATLVVSKLTATVTLGNLAQTYTGSPLSATATTVPAGLIVIISYNGSVTAPTAGGSYGVVATVSNADYAGSATGTMTIAPLAPSVRLSSSSNPAVTQTGVTFTASVTSTVGTPTGTVSFLDGTTPLGQGTLSAGVATLTTSSLADGSHSITAVYNGGTNFMAAASAAVSQYILDFSLTSGSGSSATTQTAAPGGAATYPLNIVPNNGAIFPTPILLTVTGMPAGATAVIAPSSWAQLTANSWNFPANTPLPSMTLTIQLPPASTSMKKGPASGKLPIVWGLLLLPFAVRMRGAGKRLRGIIFTLLLTAAGLGALSILSGCATGNGFFGQQQSSYTVTVTATSGPLTRSTNLTLNVE
jgi:hypothetical protein